MSIEHPLPAIDALGAPVGLRDVVRLVVIPDWLTHDLPADEAERLKSFEGAVMPVLDIDAFGYLWFGVEGPWFCLRPNEVQVLGGREDAV